ncbi:hypothetical protein TEA_027755 [Camellia sinensis var. sinensis]|uniref:Glycosyltransferase N-terminal domain-containing protein n=1 Tax=Camellia sinensis var. sinensis TaxID=542762 RepID=A0A4S4E562_CAMSN|nr:hypothetical protein TEA_027755 [Camellia sinensis var. sinensis]
MDSKQSKMNVLIRPWLAHDHISPFLELTKKLSERNSHRYFCSTPINLKSIKKRITDKYSLSIELVKIHLPSLPELAPHYHTTNGLPIHLNSTLQEAFEMASPNFTNILKALSPDLVIHDFKPALAQPIAFSYNIPAVHLMTSGAMPVCFSRHIFHPEVEFPFPTIQLHEFHEKLFHQMMETAAKTSKEKQVIPVNNDQPPCNFMLFNTFRELEGKYIDYLSAIGEKRAVPVGPLVQGIVDDQNDNSEIIQWLDNNGEYSTVFVSFGSEYFMSKEEIEEIAHGLELSNVNFIWVVRFPMGEKIEVEEALPKGVKFRVPIVAMPMHLEHPFNAKLVEEVDVTVEVNRDINGRLNKEEIAQAIRKDVDWILGYLGVLLEMHLINAVSNRNSSNASGLSLSGNEIRRGRGRRGRRGRQEMPLPDDVPAL